MSSQRTANGRSGVFLLNNKVLKVVAVASLQLVPLHISLVPWKKQSQARDPTCPSHHGRTETLPLSALIGCKSCCVPISHPNLLVFFSRWGVASYTLLLSDALTSWGQ